MGFFLALAANVLPAGAEDPSMVLEAEAFDRFDEGALFLPETLKVEGTPGTLNAVVRSQTTGRPTWLEYDFEIRHAGSFGILVWAGGNNGHQAGWVSLDGGEAVPVEDLARRSGAVTPYRVGVVHLADGHHVLRVAHAERPHFSNAFGYDKVELRRLADDARATFAAGDCPARPGEKIEPAATLALHTSLRFYGTDDTIHLLVRVENRGGEQWAPSLDLRVVNETGAVVHRTPGYQLGDLAPGTGRTLVQSVQTLGLVPGTYQLEGILEGGDGTPLAGAHLPVEIQEYKIPEWVKRARFCWHLDLHHGRENAAPVSMDRLEKELESFADRGATAVNLGNHYLFYGASPSYPTKRDYRRVVDRCHELGMKYTWYQTSITVSEYFFYQHRDWWTSPPFYHCSWLSALPESRPWSEYLACDLETLVSRAGLDGVFLDNASATGDLADREGMLRAYAEVADHLARVRAGVKRGNPLGALVPNFGFVNVPVLGQVRASWDAQLTERFYAAEAAEPSGSAQALRVRDFVHTLGRLRRVAGKPVWPLPYPAGLRSGNLTAGAIVATGCALYLGPRVDADYGRFADRYQDYFYSPLLMPLPAESVTGEPDDEHAAVCAYERVHPGGAVDRVVHVLNGGAKDREFRVLLRGPGVPGEGVLLSPEDPEPQPVRADRTGEGDTLFTLRPGTWSVLLLTKEPGPYLALSPKAIRVTRGEASPVTVRLTNRAPHGQQGTISFSLPAGLAAEPAESLYSLEAGAVLERTVLFRADGTLAAGGHEFACRTTYGERELDMPGDLEVLEPLAVEIHPDHFPNVSAAPPGMTLAVRNHSRARRLAGTLDVMAPAGWNLQPSSFAFDLDPGGEQGFSAEAVLPRVDLDGFFDLRDVPLILETITGKDRWTREIPIRIHSPIVWSVFCDLGSPPKDTVRTGAGGSSVHLYLNPVATGFKSGNLGQALKMADELLDHGENAVLWLRAHGPTTALEDDTNCRALELFVQRGGGLLLQENIFRASVENRVFFESPVCPISGPYEVTDDLRAWHVTDPQHPAMQVFVGDVLQGSRDMRVEEASVAVTVKPWAEVVAATENGLPAVVLSRDPSRKVGYIAGALEGKYLYEPERRGVRAPAPDDRTYLLTLLAEVTRWLGRPIE